MTLRANTVLHVVDLSSRNEVDNLWDMPRSVCSDAALQRVRTLLAADGLDPETGVSIRVTEVSRGRAELRADRAQAAAPIRAWVCWEAARADRYWAEISMPLGDGDLDPVPWLSENVSVPWLAIKTGQAGDATVSGRPTAEAHRLLEAAAWILIEDWAEARNGATL